MGGLFSPDVPEVDNSQQEADLAAREAELEKKKKDQQKKRIARLRQGSEGSGFLGQGSTDDNISDTLG